MLSISSGGKGKVGGGGHMDAQALKSITFVLQTFKQALLSYKSFFFLGRFGWGTSIADVILSMHK